MQDADSAFLRDLIAPRWKGSLPMEFGDYSPPQWPSLDQQRDALRKGLGRAARWAANGHLDEGPLLESCLRDRYDAQIDDSRGDWLWPMIRAAGATERFRVPILHALYALDDDRTAQQLCELARYYAETGDETFRARLYEIVEQKPIADTPWLGEDEVIQLDGEKGFLFAARVRGRLLAHRDWEWDDESLVGLAAKRIGEESVNGLFAASSDEAVARFGERWRREGRGKAETEPPGSYRKGMAGTPVEAVIREAEGAGECFWLRGWGRHADEADLRSVLKHLWEARAPRVIANLLNVFTGRTPPEFDPRFIELCRQDDERVRRLAFAAVARNDHPLIRGFALTELPKGIHDGSVVDLFINNYRQGDEERILEAIASLDEECALHSLLFGVIDVLEANPDADGSRLGVVAYASTPCEKCRFRAARLLLDRRVAPDWLSDECRYDSGEESRALVEDAEESTAEGSPHRPVS